MSLPSTSNRGCNAPPPVVVGHLVATAGVRARVVPARPLLRAQQRQRTVVQAITQEEEVASRHSPVANTVATGVLTNVTRIENRSSAGSLVALKLGLACAGSRRP